MYRLFVVDDEPLTREFIRNHLSELHAEWQFEGEAGDGQEALDLLGDGRQVDLLLTDIKMPVMDGLELSRNAAQLYPNLKIVILSGYDEFALVQEAMRHGVCEYLLKPVVKTELIGMLSKLAEQLKLEHARRIAHETMVGLSETTRTQVVHHFLQAVISENYAEIKALYPLLYRMKASLIEAEGVVMALELDEGQLLKRDISPRDLPMFHYIMHQAAAELTAAETGATPFFDREQRTCLLVTADNEAELAGKCRRLFASISETMRTMTGLEVWGAIGTVENESLQLNVSYRKALSLLKKRLFYSSACLFADDSAEAGAGAGVHDITKLERAVAGIRSAMAEPHGSAFALALKSYIELMDAYSAEHLLRFGLFLLRSLRRSQEDAPLTDYESAMLRLQQASRQERLSASASQETVSSVFRDMLQPLALAGFTWPETAGEEEHEIVKKAKAYIMDHYAEPISLALIAEKTGVTPGYLSNLFQQNDNESYIKFLTRVRMEHAAKLLRVKPAHKVYAVSEKVGYVSVKHFSHVFKQFFGIPPGEYQEKA